MQPFTTQPIEFDRDVSYVSEAFDQSLDRVLVIVQFVTVWNLKWILKGRTSSMSYGPMRRVF